MQKIVWIVAMLVVTGAVALGWAYSGQYDVAADAPHWDITTRALATIRERSIEARAADLIVPNLADPALIALGAEHYAAMCVGCHLAPGVGDNEMRQGLYPQPPNLSQPHDRSPHDRSPAESFWIIKHGLKMSGMPAWGVTHDDEAIWGLVAFLQQLPAMDATAYAAFAQDGGEAGHGNETHEHGGTESDGDGSSPVAGATTGESAGAGDTHVHPDGEGHDH